MINDEERERRERARERISGPVKHLLPMSIPTIGIEFDMTDRKTTLIYENPLTAESCWRTEGGVYVIWMLNGGGPRVISTAEAQRTMSQRESYYTWYITEAETKDFKKTIRG